MLHLLPAPAMCMYMHTCKSTCMYNMYICMSHVHVHVHVRVHVHVPHKYEVGPCLDDGVT